MKLTFWSPCFHCECVTFIVFAITLGNAQYAARSEQINPVMTSTNGYNQPMPQHNYTAPPPLYTEIDQGPPADFQMAPPPYEEVVKSNEGNIPHNSEHIDQPAAPQQQAEEPTSQSTATVTPPSQ